MTIALGMCHGARSYTLKMPMRSMMLAFLAGRLGIVPAAYGGHMVHGSLLPA